jgi:group I intron endonuclease
MDIRKPGIYAIINKVNGKMYIGFTTQKIKVRYNQHLKALRKGEHNKHLLRAFKKYGESNFEIKALLNVDKKDFDKLPKLELEYFEKYNTLNKNYGYNINDGTNEYHKGYKFTDEQKENLSKAEKKVMQMEEYIHGKIKIIQMKLRIKFLKN